MNNAAVTKAGWIMTGLYTLFMLGASVTPKLLGLQPALDSLEMLGWPVRYVVPIGVIELVCVLLFLYPRTALLGAIITTGLLGGALASHLRVGSPWFSHTLFGIYLGGFMWLALWLRDDTVRRVLPFNLK
jgi:hypothetical protein